MWPRLDGDRRVLFEHGMVDCGRVAPVRWGSKSLRRTRDVSRLGRGHDSPVLPGLAGEEERQQMTKRMIV
ncbi:hypothetical protein MRX96_014701 [Rhipicephalus microplus]